MVPCRFALAFMTFTVSISNDEFAVLFFPSCQNYLQTQKGWEFRNLISMLDLVND